MKADLVIHNAGQLITCASGGKPKRGKEMQNVGIINDGAVAISDDKIVAVGKSDEILQEFSAKDTIDAEKKVVSPGFVDCHTHIVFAGNRLNEFELKIKGADYLEILENGGGIISTVRQTRAASLTDLINQTLVRLDKMLALGTTTAEIKTGYGLETETELKMLEVIFELDDIHQIDLIPTFLPAHAFPTEYKESQNKYVELICREMLPQAIKIYKQKTQNSKFKIQNLFADVFCEKGAFNLEQSRLVLETAKNLGYKLKAHVDEFTNLGGARLAIELGATSIDHLDTISAEEVSLLANSETIGVVTPTVNFNFGSAEFADARNLIDSGCAVAVSTDFNPGSAPCPSLPNALAIACRYQKLLPSESFNAATINAAFAVGAGSKIGSLETGKFADLLILDTDDYRQTIYEFGGNFVQKVIKKGSVISM